MESARKRLGWNMPYKQELETIDDLVRKVVPEMTDSLSESPYPVPTAATLSNLQKLSNDTATLEQRMNADHAETDQPKPRMVAARQELVLMGNRWMKPSGPPSRLWRTSQLRPSH